MLGYRKTSLPTFFFTPLQVVVVVVAPIAVVVVVSVVLLEAIGSSLELARAPSQHFFCMRLVTIFDKIPNERRKKKNKKHIRIRYMLLRGARATHWKS